MDFLIRFSSYGYLTKCWVNKKILINHLFQKMFYVFIKKCCSLENVVIIREEQKEVQKNYTAVG